MLTFAHIHTQGRKHKRERERKWNRTQTEPFTKAYHHIQEKHILRRRAHVCIDSLNRVNMNPNTAWRMRKKRYKNKTSKGGEKRKNDQACKWNKGNRRINTVAEAQKQKVRETQGAQADPHLHTHILTLIWMRMNICAHTHSRTHTERYTIICGSCGAVS